MANILTQEEHDKLKAELSRLYNAERPQVAKDLKEAIAQGDLSENAAYAEAKERQSEIETKIREIENRIAMSEVVEERAGTSDVIRIGASFRARDEQSGQERTFSIVGPEVSNPLEGKISFDSPLGKEFLGKKKDEVIEVTTPSGKRKYTVLEIV
jgi:transcription elongation factor GreA